MKRLLLLLFVTVLLPLLAEAQGVRYDNIALQNSGGFAKIVPNASVKLCIDTGCSIPAVIFSDIGLTHTINNPTTADLNGNFFFYTLPGTYTLIVSGIGVNAYTLQNITLPCVVGSACIGSTILPTIVIPFTTVPVFNAPVALGVDYQITLTASVTASTVGGTPVDGTLMSFHIIQDGNGPWAFVWPTSFQNTPTIATSGSTDVTYKFMSSIGAWTPLITTASGGGGGGFVNPMAQIGQFICSAAGGAPVACGPGKTGQVPTAINAAQLSFISPGLSGTNITTSPYTVQCDNSTALIDRVTTLILKPGASVVNFQNPATSGCGNNFVVTLANDNAGTVTINRGTTDVFNILNGSSHTDGVTTWTMSDGQFATINSPDNANWLVRIPISGGGGGSSPNQPQFCTGGGTANSITATCPLTHSSYAAGTIVSLVPPAANTAQAVVLNVDGLGTKNVLNSWGQTLTPSDLTTKLAQFQYDGTQFVLLNPQICTSLHCIVYTCSTGTLASQASAPPVNTVLVACPAIPPNTMRSADIIEAEWQGEVGTATSGTNDGPFAIGLAMSGVYMITCTICDVATVSNHTGTGVGGDEERRYYITVGGGVNPPSGATTVGWLSASYITGANSGNFTSADNNPTIDPTISQTPQIIMHNNAPTGSFIFVGPFRFWVHR